MVPEPVVPDEDGGQKPRGTGARSWAWLGSVQGLDLQLAGKAIGLGDKLTERPVSERAKL